MARPLRRVACAVAAALAATTTSFVALSTTAAADQPRGYGPVDPFDDSLKPDDGPMEPMRDKAKVIRTKYGYRFTAAQQNTHLRLSVTNGRLRFRDTNTPRWKSLPRACNNQRVSPGVAATCRIPAADPHVLLEVHPRLGNDYVDGRGLPSKFEMAVLGDQGRDTVFGGRGRDYVTGAQYADRIRGGAGKDWIRGGDSRDRIWGDDHSDWIVGMSGRDYIRGGGGADRIFQ